MRSQLDVDAARAAEVDRLMALVAATIERTKAETGQTPVSETWSGTLELVLVMLETVLPRDFDRFKSFVAWRDTLHNALLQTLLQGVRDSWVEEDAGGGAGGASGEQSARALVARLKGGLRRCDVRSADDFDEDEYREAVAGLGATAMAIVRRLKTGWRFPWGLRVRLCEVLLRGVFDSLEEGAYIEEADEYLRMLQTRVWPLVGVSSLMHNSCFAWIHFRQFVVTKSPVLVGSTKSLLRRLAQLGRSRGGGGAGSSSRGARSSGGGGGSGATDAAAAAAIASVDGGGGGGGGGAAERSAPSASASAGGARGDDAALISEVGACVIDWIGERLGDYHRRAKLLGGPKVLAGLVDVLAFAAQGRGDAPEAVADVLIGAIHASVEKELQRRVAAAGPHESEAAELAAAVRAARDVAELEADVWAPAFASQLPEAGGVAAARLHSLVGARYLPFLSGASLEPSTLEVLRLAMEAEPALLAPAARALPEARAPAARRLLEGARSWGTLAQLTPVLARWVAAQAAGFDVWVRRAFEKEDWRPLGDEQPHSQSARELRRMVLESLDALFGFGIPLPAEAVAAHLEAMEGVFAT